MASLTLVWRERATDAAVIVVAWSFAIAQPLLDVLGRNPEFFVAHSSTKLDIVGTALGLTLVAPLVLAGLITLVDMASRTAGRIVHRVVLGALVAEFVLQIVKNVGGLPAVLQIGIPVLVGAGAAWVYDRRAGLRGLSWWFLPAPLLFLALFLVSPVNGLVFTDDVPAGPGVTIGKPAPVVLVVLDELPVISLLRPDGTLDRAAYPNFARLADRSVWFRNTTADWPNTERSVPTILTGRIHTAAVPTASENPKSIFTLLGGAYSVEAWEPITKLCPESLCGPAESDLSGEDRVDQLLDDTRVIAGHVLLPDELAKSLPPVDRSWAQFGGEATERTGSADRDDASSDDASSDDRGSDDDAGTDPTDAPVGSRQQLAYANPSGAVAGLADAMARDGDRTLYVMHLKFPHFPWRYLPTGQQYDAGNELPGYEDNFWGDDPRLPELALARHLLQVRYADALVGRVLDQMDARGLTGKGTLVVTADHGAAFDADGPRRDPDAARVGDIAYVPLFVSAPGVAPRIDDRPANLDDVVPTIADSLDVQADGWSWSGTSLLAGAEPHRRRVMTSMHDHALTLRDTAAERDAALARRWARYPGLTSFDDWHDVFRVGPLGPLVGSQVPATDVLAGAEIELDQRDQLDDYDPEGELAPVMLTGTATGVPDGRDFAVSLNGTVAGVGRSYDGDAFTAMVSPSDLRAGRNDVGILMADDDGYHSVAVHGTERWSPAPGGGAILNADGRRTPVVDGALSGYVTSDAASGITTVRGWAVRTDDPQAGPVRIVVFRGRRFLGTTQTGDARADVAAKLGPGYLNSGFKLSVSEAPRHPARRAPIVAYAVTGGRASVLQVVP